METIELFSSLSGRHLILPLVAMPFELEKQDARGSSLHWTGTRREGYDLDLNGWILKEETWFTQDPD